MRDQLLENFKNLKIRTKILAGYMVALGLAAIVGMLAIFQLNQVNATVVRLTGHLAQERDLAEETSVQIHRIRLYADQYISQGQTPADLQNYNQAISDSQTLLDEADQIITEKNRIDLQAQARENFDRFAATFAEIVQILTDRQDVVTNVLNPQGESSVEKLALLRNNSFETLDFTSAHYASQARDTFSQMQVGAIEYMATGNEQFAAQVENDFDNITSTFDLLNVSVRDENSRQLVAQVTATTQAYYDGFHKIRLLVARQHDLTNNQLDVHGRAVDQLANDITNDINQEFAAENKSTSLLVTQTRLIILLAMILIIGVGFLFGLVLSRKITRPIEDVALAAQGIAAGAFDQQVNIQSNDELGILADAFNHMTTHIRETMTALNQSLVSLRESEQRYRGLFEDSPIALWEQDCSVLKKHLDRLRDEGVTNWQEYFENHPDEVRACAGMIIIKDANRAAFVMHKFTTREGLLGPLSNVFIEKTYENFHEDLISLANGNTIFDKETVHRTVFGEKILIQLRLSIFPGCEDDWSKILVSLVDITNRKQAEARLRESEERFASAFEYAPIGMSMVSLDGHWLKVNQALCRIAGYTREELLARTFQEITYPPDLETDLNYVQRMLKGEIETYQMEKRYLHKLGHTVWVLLAVSLMRDENGEPLYFISQIKDITERKQAEDALRKSQARLNAVVTSAMDAIITVNENQEIVLFNPAAEKIFQRAAADVMGQKIDGFIPARYRDVHQKHFSLFAQAGQTNRAMGQSGLINGIRANGEEFPIDASISRIDMPDQHLYTVILRDITDRKRAEQNLALQFEHLRTLSIIDQAIITSSNLNLTLGIFIGEVMQQLGVDAASVLLFDPSEKVLTFAAGQGLRDDALYAAPLQLNHSLAGQAALERRLVHVSNLAGLNDDLATTSSMVAQGFVSYYAVPLVAKDQSLGVLEVFHRAGFSPTEDWLTFLQTMAGQAAIAIDNAILFNDLHHSNMKLEQAYDSTIEGWSRALDLRDKETEGHSQRVTRMTLKLAQAVGLAESEQVHIRRGALLHDIGKMGVPDGILLKPGPLTDDEWKIMRQHPQLAYEMLASIEYLQPALDIPYCHHEKWDGSGYPRGLKGEEIPLAARIFALADVYDALTSDRPYRKAWSQEKTLEHIRSLAGTHFEPQAVVLLFQAIEEGEG